MIHHQRKSGESLSILHCVKMHDDVDAVYGKEYHQKAKLSERNQKPKYFRKEVS